MVHPFKGTRAARSRMARIGLGAFACTTTITIASALVTPVAGAQSSTGSAARLASAVADAQSDVDALQLGIGDLQESVNQSFVDLRDAQARAEQARRASSAAAERLAAAEDAVTEARKALEEITRAQYRGSGQPGVVGALAGEDGQKDALDRAGYLRQRSVEKREALEAVERARTEAANEESLVREASQLASASEEDAKRAEERTRELLESRQAELAGRESELAAAQAQLNEAQAQLAEARGGRGEPETTPATPATAATQEPPAQLDPERVAPEDIERVQRQVEQLAPEAQVPSRDEVARALATAQTAQVETPELSEATETPETTEATETDAQPQVQFTDEVVGQAASIAAATALVGESQAPHATFADPYAARGRLNQGDAREIIGAFVGGFQTGLGLGAPAAAETSSSADSTANVGDISDTLLTLLPEVSTPDTVTEAVQETVQAAGSASVEAVIARAQSMVGTPYVWGGGDANGPTTGVNGGSLSGFDCSGLVLYAYSAAGISLPHYTGYQYQRGTQVDPSEAKRGDLLFWGPGGSQHVAIYLGDGMMIEAPQAGQNVSVVPVRWAGMSDKAVRLL